MSKSSFVNGSARIIVNDNASEILHNYDADDRLLQWFFERTVRDDRNMFRGCEPTSNPAFLRPGKLRYTKPDELMVFAAANYTLDNINGTAFGQYMDPTDTLTSPTDPRRWRYSYNTSTFPTTDIGFAFGSVAYSHTDRRNGTNASSGGPGFPDNWRYGAALTWIDIPGTQIGNIFPHPPGRSAWYNEVGQTALSQGSIEIEGVFGPDETLLQHLGYQVYYTKTGGTGRPGDASNPDLTAAIDGAAGSVSTGSDTFTDGAAQGLFQAGVHDTGIHYIRIQSGLNVGTFLITSVTDVDNVVVDASTINQPFATEGSISWEMVSGPVGEYFWRRRAYYCYDNWSSTIGYNYGNFNPQIVQMAHDVAEDWDDDTPPVTTIHDRGACWWAAFSRMGVSSDAGQLVRYVHNSPQSFEPMNDPAKWSGGYPVGLAHFTDMVIDDQNKIWLSMLADGSSASADSSLPLIRFDPYPSGDAHTPEYLSSWNQQSSDSDATGIVNAANAGLVADDSQAYAAGTRIWVFSKDDPTLPSSEGGISYTDDYGVTWKRLHYLTTVSGTASVSVGTSSVTGVGTSFDTEFAVGDWVRFAGDTRSYEIQSIAGPLSMTLATNHATGVSGVTIERGALSLDQSRIYFNNSAGNSIAGTYTLHPPCDYDSDGNVYWVNNARTAVCKWDESAGQVTEVTTVQLSTTQTITSGSQLYALQVQKVPDPDGQGPAPLHNSIWVTTSSQGCARIDPVFDGTHTRYNYNLSNNWPTSIDMQSGTSTVYNHRVVIEPLTGQAFILGVYQSGSHESRFQYTVYGIDNDGTTGSATNLLGTLVDNNIPSNFTSVSNQAIYWGLINPEFDDVGLGGIWQVGANTGSSGTDANSTSHLAHPCWICKRWNGSQWNTGPVNQIDTNIYFADNEGTYAGPWVDIPVSVGSGLKRMHPGFQSLDSDTGLRIRFVDSNPQSTAQDQQFLIDETSTFVCFVGRGKDNTQEASYSVDAYTSPSILRQNYETPKLVRNMWTQDGGIDGFYVTGSTVDNTGDFARGIAEYDEFYNRATAGDPYPPFDTWTFSSPSTYKQFGASLRIPDEGEFSGDGSTSAGSDVFTTAGGYTFVAGDVGKSIIVEGVNGATPDVDNGQAVIIAYVSPTQVQTDKTFAATNGGLRWKLRDIPVVSYVVMDMEYTRTFYAVLYGSYNLYSSSDLGVNYDLVKSKGDLTTGTANAPDWSASIDPGVYFSDAVFNRITPNATADPYASLALIVDLTDLPENVRRRQYWKFRGLTSSGGTNPHRGVASIHLLDDQRLPLGRPANCEADDSRDPLFDGMYPLLTHERVWSGINTATAVDDGDGDSFTDSVTMAGENFYLQSGVNNAQLSGNDFIGGSWAPEDVGKFIRIENAVNSVNNGWAVVTAYVNSGRVTTGKAFTSETNTFDWQVTSVGENDLLQVIDDTLTVPSDGVTLSEQFYSIADVPTSSSLLLTSKSFPNSVSAKPFFVNRVFPDGSSSSVGSSGGAGFDTLLKSSHSVIYGTMGASSELEFVVLEEDIGSPTATTGADSDGDGRVDTVVLPVSVVPEAVAGDYLMIDGTGGRRVYEIKTITRDSPVVGQTEIVVTYDEIKPSGTFTWQVLRRRDIEQVMPNIIYYLKETAP